jgi:hypothetical protein
MRIWSYALFALAVVGALIGLYIGLVHVDRDPAADVHAYYEAGQRLNAGIPLYEQTVSTDGSRYYFYPPLLAIAFRPLALLPFEVAASIWVLLMVLALTGTVWLLGVRNRWGWLALGWLAPAIAWALTIGQAHVATTFLMTLGTPFGLALAGHLKIFPALAAVYWLGLRDWRRLRWFVGWSLGLAILSFVLEPNGSIAFLGFPSLDLVGEVMNLSPYAISPVLWGVLVVALGAASLVFARTRYGWLAAVALSVFANPRLLMYQLSSFLAAVRVPGRPADH